MEQFWSKDRGVVELGPCENTHTWEASCVAVYGYDDNQGTCLNSNEWVDRQSNQTEHQIISCLLMT